MKSEISSRTVRATMQAGRMASRSRSFFRMIIAMVAPAPLEAALDAALFQESIVMAHQQMRFHLAHGIEHHADENQHAGAAEERRDRVRHLEEAVQDDRNNRDDRQEDG